MNGENPISFCNVFFVLQVIVRFSALLTGRRGLRRQLGSLDGRARRLLGLHGVLGMFLGPIATDLALGSLAMISQPLLFALVLPVSTLLAAGWSRGPAEGLLDQPVLDPGRSAAGPDRDLPVWGERQRPGPIRSATWAVEPPEAPF